MFKFFSASVIGSLLLASLAPAAEAAAPIAATQVVAGNQEKRAVVPAQTTEYPIPPGWELVSWDDPDANNEKTLPGRVMERGAGKIGSSVGAAMGTAAGYAILGLPGGLIGAGVGAVVGEVFFEFITSNWLRGITSGPVMPRMIVPQMPKR